MTIAPAPTDPAYGAPDLSAQYNTAISSAINSANPFQSVAGELAGQEANQLATGQLGIAGAEAQYGLNNAQTAINNLYNNQLAGYQLGQLGINQQQQAIQQTGLTQQEALQGVEQPIQTSQLVGGLAASGALNTKGSTQAQQELTAQQKYTNEELQNAQQQLNLLAKSNGMSQQEVYNQLAYMTSEGQLQGYENPIQLLNTIAQVYEGGLSGVENILGPAGLSAGLNLFPGQP
jgi:hypothetical protein